MHLIMNRQNTDNLVENLLDFEYELKKPYLLYRNAAQEVNGIWFYNEDECEEVANLFNRILSEYSKIPPNAFFHLCHRAGKQIVPNFHFHCSRRNRKPNNHQSSTLLQGLDLLQLLLIEEEG
ncbi:mRNA-decapping enzyme-like protein [Arachis ipaensis]|uniref:mRNA-decapping enzyme-like protein n=1 Tax=Arachis ipaensis TaxID=130454 RepID=UPI000A2AFEC7|nr:mRNA-decapping enzyme-like protein [Arachis ipaensis]